MVIIQQERSGDAAAVHRLNCDAFMSGTEADLVDALRQQAQPFISLVALEDEAVVGHIAFSLVEADPPSDARIAGLAPMAVAPAFQRRGIGTLLVNAGLDVLLRQGFDAVVVLGHPAYYPRFGFVPASRFGLRSTYDVPDEVFMAREIRPGSLSQVGGTVRYHRAFGG